MEKPAIPYPNREKKGNNLPTRTIHRLPSTRTVHRIPPSEILFFAGKALLLAINPLSDECRFFPPSVSFRFVRPVPCWNGHIFSSPQ